MPTPKRKLPYVEQYYAKVYEKKQTAGEGKGVGKVFPIYKTIPSGLRNLYGDMISHRRMSAVLLVAEYLVMTAATVMLFISGVSLVELFAETDAYGMSYTGTETGFAYTFGIAGVILSLVIDKIARTMFNKHRKKISLRADKHIETVLEKYPESEEKELASSTKRSFADTLDSYIMLWHEVSMTLAIAFFTVYCNIYAGLPLVIFTVIMLWMFLHGKNNGFVYFMASKLLPVAYYLSTIVLVVLHKLPFGGMMGYFAAILFVKYAIADIPKEIGFFLTQCARSGDIEKLIQKNNI